MDKVYNPKEIEGKIYQMWEQHGYFKPEINPNGDPYCIILPPPNANGNLHFGHAMFVIEDILIRYHRMQGLAALWLPGTDHAGTETQFVFEKKLQSEGKSRFDFTREDLYQKIWEYVQENRGGIESQLKRLGFSLDWSRSKFTLDKDIVEIVNQTFKHMYEDGLIYRDYRLVNYCTKDGTSFSDLEAVSKESEGILYYVKYPIKEGGHITVATTRPETMFGDVAVMVNPQDKRYKQYIGKTVILPLTNREIPIIADEYVDKEFGTGAVKVTPSHDFNDFEVGKRHSLSFPPIIGWNGKFEKTDIVDGLYAKQARTETVKLLQEKDLLEKQESHKMVIKVCYKCGTVLEPLPLEQWYIKVTPLVQKSLQALEKQYIKVYPKNFTAMLESWLRNLRDWNISRQNVWGIRIPIWYEIENEEQFAVTFIDKQGHLKQGNLKMILQEGNTLEEVLSGLQKVIAKIDAKVVFAEQKQEGKRYLPETDTFDTWFSSGQWPYLTLKTSKKGDFEKFYPTSVMETGRDILFSWVSRMIMLGVYLTSKANTNLQENIPFKDVVLHGLVNDPFGKKMSKSKGNVVNPLEIADQYGADAVRFALVYGTALGNDQAMSYPKLDAARKFTNKLWNMARFIELQLKENNIKSELKVNLDPKKIKEDDQKMLKRIKELSNTVTENIKNYQFNFATENLYNFIWHEVADKYIEYVKVSEDKQNTLAVLLEVYRTCLKLLHPFMPFITEEIYQKLYAHLPHSQKSLMIEKWPA
jgi:valyl-tRNA synthetase